VDCTGGIRRVPWSLTQRCFRLRRAEEKASRFSAGMNPTLPFTLHQLMSQLDIPRYSNPTLPFKLVYLHRLRMAKQVVTRTYTLPYGTSLRCKTTLIRSGSLPRSSGTSDGGRVVGSGMKSIISRTTTNSPRTSKPTNATMTCIRSQVSESFKNSLKRSTVGTVNDATGTRTRIRPATANTAMTTHVPRSHSKLLASSSIPSTTAFDSQRGRTSRTTGRTSFFVSTKPAPTSISPLSRTSNRCE